MILLRVRLVREYKYNLCSHVESTAMAQFWLSGEDGWMDVTRRTGEAGGTGQVPKERNGRAVWHSSRTTGGTRTETKKKKKD